MANHTLTEPRQPVGKDTAIICGDLKSSRYIQRGLRMVEIDERIIKRKKILLFHHCDGLGGAGISLFNTYKMLKEEYEVKVYLPHYSSQLENYFKNHNAKINTINDNVGMISSYSGGPKVFSRTFVNNLVKIIDTRKVLQSIIKSEKPDVVAVNSMTLAWAGKLIQRNGIKSLCFIRETYVDNLGMRFIQHSLNKWFDGVIFISEHDKKKFKCKAPVVGTVRDSVHMTDYLIDLTRSQACETLGIDSESFNILFVGGTSELKGWTVVTKAIKKLMHYNINLIVAGRLIKSEMVINDRIKYIGEQSNMPIVYRASDILVFPSTSPHQARPAFEAGFMGLPVIISDFEETREQIQNEVNGLTFKYSNSDDLAKKILKLYEDREFSQKLGQANKEHAARFHEFENCKQTLLTLVNELIGTLSNTPKS